MYKDSNPFTFGALALDEAFTDREEELRELTADMRNGQDILVFAPRRYGKSSLVLRAAQEAIAAGVLVGYCDLMRTPTKEKFASALAKTIYEDIASPVGHALERAAALFRGLRVRPTIEVDPDDASVRFTFAMARRSAEIDDTIEKLLELPATLAGERRRRVAIVFDEFQEIVRLDERFPNLMRAVFQAQPEVGHVYLGSKRHVLERIFSDKNEPFWRSAKRLEIGLISLEKFRPFIKKRFADTDKGITDEALERLLASTGGHPYGTQELCYFTWQETPPRGTATAARVAAALDGVLRSEHAHFSLAWSKASAVQRSVLQALAREPGHVLGAEYRARHGLPAASSVQKALDKLEREELVARRSGHVTIAEPFLAEWLMRR